jgi:hypothetical protein
MFSSAPLTGTVVLNKNSRKKVTKSQFLIKMKEDGITRDDYLNGRAPSFCPLPRVPSRTWPCS